MEKSNIYISAVVPVFNEGGFVNKLFSEIKEVIDKMNRN